MKEAALFLVALAVGGGLGALMVAPAAPAAEPVGELPPTPLVAPARPLAPSPSGDDSEPKGTRVRHDGSLGSTFSICTPGFPCINQGQTDRKVLGRASLVREFDLKATWAATSPVTERLHYSLRVCAQSCRGTEPILALAEGGSPLRFAGTLPEPERDGNLVLEVAPANASPSPESTLRTATTQPYRVEGVLR